MLGPLAIAAAVALGATACQGGTTTPSTPSGAPSATADAAPELVPNGSAEDNKPYFDAVAQKVYDADNDASGRAFIDALVDAGFDKEAMEVTADTTTVGNRVESLQFSVRWGDECIIGQTGSAIGAYTSVVMDVLDTGTCLVGVTRPIDW